MAKHLQQTDKAYKVYLYIFYVCAFAMLAIMVYGTWAMYVDWQEDGYYVMGEVLVNTEFPFAHFAKLTTWLFFACIIGWYCVSRIGWKKAVGLHSWRMSLLQLMLLGFAIINLYEVLYNFVMLNAQVTAGIIDGKMPDIDRLTIAYPDHTRPWNLIFATKIFLVGFLISAHAFYLSTRPRKSQEELET
ncbi:MAG: hypothetical protein EB150_01980 [Nitrososphaeria archaeon]|nr:hypothetical protein [Nitrososphaeria archaeon]NDB51145.1 hypothetical protein [Nitrosopumilaceae archaeon]NDB87856.1 hypothetical protein [Nitrososphaerota archaeon]NDB46278.1 hypothetical protein [Nitrososphaeria archaeon]NDB62975.1 hypothetical protein [Nitrosopumilaceae archaeon]